jgi:hypothetical protein
MKDKPVSIEITDGEEALLQEAQRVVEAIAARYHEACGADLDLKLEFKSDVTGKYNGWWRCQHNWSWQRAGSGKSIRDAIKQMVSTTDAAVKRATAKHYREKADQLEKEARKLSKGD